MRYIIFLLCQSLIYISLSAQSYSTRSFSDEINSLRVTVDSDNLSDPIALLHPSQNIEISFDLLSYEHRSFDWKIIHCSKTWQESDISSMEYVNGFDNGNIDDYEYSINTTANYIHYTISFPNENTKLTKSGNYALIVTEDYDYENPLATFCFSLSEDIVSVQAKSTANTLYEISGKYQQLEIELDYSGIHTSTPSNEFTVVIEQNSRQDNAQYLSLPTFTQVNKLIYRDKKELVFEGGNSYRSIDFASEYTYGAGIERIEGKDNVMHVMLEPSKIRALSGADLSLHANGKFVINKQNTDEDDTEADYMWVHFVLPMENPLLNGSMYLIGDFSRNNANGEIRLQYDFDNKEYFADVYLKQGGYNFLYAFKQKGYELMSLAPIEGSFWQTDNNYVIKVYFRAFGDRYDRLVAVHKL